MLLFWNILLIMFTPEQPEIDAILPPVLFENELFTILTIPKSDPRPIAPDPPIIAEN